MPNCRERQHHTLDDSLGIQVDGSSVFVGPRGFVVTTQLLVQNSVTRGLAENLDLMGNQQMRVVDENEVVSSHLLDLTCFID